MTIAVSGVSAEATATPGTSVEVTPPSLSDGQFMMMIAGYGDDASTPRLNESGWTSLGTVAGVADTDCEIAIWGKFAASESGTYTVDTTEGTSFNIRARMVVFDGVHVDMLDQTSVNGPDTANSTSYDPAAIVTQTANAMVITAIVAAGGSASNFTDPSGYTNIFQHTLATPAIEAAYIMVASPGSEDPPAWTGLGAVRDTIGITLALKAAVASSLPIFMNQYRSRRN